MAPGTYSFDINLHDMSYEFQFGIAEGESNKDVQERIINIADEIIVISDGNILKHGDKDIILPEITGTENAINICHKMA